MGEASVDETIASAFISALPQLIVVLVGAGFLVAYRRPIGEFVGRRVTSFSGLGFTVALSPEDVDRAVIAKDPNAALTRPSPSTPADVGSQVSERWQRLAPHLAGRTILWVDDDLAANRIERRLLRRMGLFVEPALTNAEAHLVLTDPNEKISLVISDIRRASGPTGIDLLGSVRQLPNPPPFIFYVSDLDPDRGAPANSLGICNRPDALLNLVMDGLDRAPAPRD